ncbi:hypothetical protein AKJ16_DCAP21128 [Drosera capensis]
MPLAESSLCRLSSLLVLAPGEKIKVCRLRKALYELEQSPRAWFDKFSDTVICFGMQQCSVDHSVFNMSSSPGLIL